MKKRLLALFLALAMLLATPAFATEYVVKSGDTLWKIAQKFLGNGSKWSEVYEANKGTVKDPNKIYVGQKLEIPDGKTEKPEEPTPKEEPKVYTGSSVGMQGPVSVAMTVQDGKILGIELTECHETKGVADVALERIPDQMVKYQTVYVDSVTGATLASGAIMAAAQAAARAAGLDMATLRANAYHAQPGPDETWDTDVLVIGGGGAGLSAAISAAQNGAKVTLIEKAAVLGGNTFHAGGAFNAVDPEGQASVIMAQATKNTLDEYLELTTEDPDLHFDQFPDWIPVLEALQEEIKAFNEANKDKTPGVDLPGFDSVNLAMWHMYIGGLRQTLDGKWTASDVNLARSLATNGIEAYKWLGTIGVSVSYGAGLSRLNTVLGAMWPRTHGFPAGSGLIEPLRTAALKAGVTIYTETAATKLCQNDAGAVVGAKAEKADGTQITINAKGVVLASGGYCANPAMVKEYDQYWGENLSDTTPSTNAGTNKGDGIKMAMAINAATRDLGISQMMPSSSPIKGSMTDGVWAGAESQLWIDNNAKRFVDEYAERDVLAIASMTLPDKIFYIVYAGAPDANGVCHGVTYNSPALGGTVKDFVEKGHIWYGSTLAELAEATKTSAGGATSSFTEAQLRAAIENYNKIVEDQYDPDFHKGTITGYIDLEAIEADPTVGICITPRKASLHHTMGGVVINTNTEVIDNDGNVISGLWAAGEVTGGVHAGNRLGGNAVADIFTHGQIAGRNAAKAVNTYVATSDGYNGPVTLAVTFNGDKVTDIKPVSHKETDHVGTSAFDVVIPDIIAAGGTGVDTLAGATFTTFAIKDAVNKAAQQAGIADMRTFQRATVKHEAQDPIEGTWDVIVVGAGGAGMAAAAQAAQNGDTVLVIEKFSEMGGNTLVAGGAFQLSRDYLVWDPADPDATEGFDADGNKYPKIKMSVGSIETLKTILKWDEGAFKPEINEELPFEAGNLNWNIKRGVHTEYLETLKTLKKQIQAYVDWAEAKMAAGTAEKDLTLFSTEELHIFQTYYGGLRPSADGSKWIYGNFDLVSQFIHEGQNLTEWLTEQGAVVSRNLQNTLIGCLWQRINTPLGGTVNGVKYDGKWGTYFKPTENTVLKANDKNDILYRTTATELLVEDGKVVGVKATQYDGTPVTVKATKGVILATGGYGANIKMVQDTNEYWKPEYISDYIGTTNRSGMVGDGIKMATAENVGAATVGMEWTQMMPLGWVDNGNLSRGSGDNVIFINPNTGKRYVDEFAERDVLSLGGFENGMDLELAKELGLKQVPGIYVELSSPVDNANIYMPGTFEGRYFTGTVEDLAEMLHLDKQVLIDTITEYDMYCMGVTDTLSVEKSSHVGLIGRCEKDADGKYLPETYTIGDLWIRFQAPSTHHTMGGLVVDTERHVLNEKDEIIPGLYAAGEVCGGFMAGNRLGGNATTEILVSGRTAANAVHNDNK